MIAKLLMLMTGSLLIAADIPKKEAAEEELEKLQGTWNLVTREINGKAFAFPEASQVGWIIKGNKVLSRPGDDKEVATIAIDPTRTPRLLDWTALKTKRVFEAIYMLEDDTWKICINRAEEGGKDRPAEFTTNDKDGWEIWILKRQKP